MCEIQGLRLGGLPVAGLFNIISIINHIRILHFSIMSHKSREEASYIKQNNWANKDL